MRLNKNQAIKNSDTRLYINCMYGFVSKLSESYNVIESLESFNLRYEFESLKKYCELSNVNFSKEIADLGVHYIYFTSNIKAFSTLLYSYKNCKDVSIFSKLNYFLNTIGSVVKNNIDSLINTFGELLRWVALQTEFKFINEFSKIYIADCESLKYSYRYWIRVGAKIIHVGDSGILIGDMAKPLDLMGEREIKINSIIGNNEDVYYSDFDTIFKVSEVDIEKDTILITI